MSESARPPSRPDSGDSTTLILSDDVLVASREVIDPVPNLTGYEVLEKIGRGGMGVVYKAVQRRLHRLVALKVIRSDRLKQHQAIERFQREVLTAARLMHPNIVMVFDAGEEKQFPYLAMEYLEGITLQRLVAANGPLSVERACDLILQLASGLQYLHEQGLVHRDIKPHNLIVVQPTGHDRPLIKILDLGLARYGNLKDEPGHASLDSGSSCSLMGTVDFIAPEQAENAQAVDIRADLYSLGCTFYYLLSGHVPFPAETPFAKLLRHRDDEPIPVSDFRTDVPDSLLKLLRKLMAKRPEHRPASPMELIQELEAICLPDSYRSGANRSSIAVDASRQGRTVPPLPRLNPERESGVRPAHRLGIPPRVLAEQVNQLLDQLNDRLNQGINERRPEERQRLEAEARLVVQKLQCLLPADARTLKAQVMLRRVFPAQQNGELHCWHEHPSAVQAVIFGRDGRLLASAGDDGLVRLWDVEDRDSLGRFDRHTGPVRALALSPSGLTVLSAGDDRAIRLWELNCGEELLTLPVTANIHALAISPDGRSGLSGDAEGRVHRWCLGGGAADELLPALSARVSGVGFCGENRYRVASSLDGGVAVWDATGHLVRILRREDTAEPPAAHCIALVEAQSLVLVGYGDGALLLWDLDTGRLLQPIEGRSSPVLAVAICPETPRALTGSQDGIARLWDLETGQELQQFVGHRQAILSVAISPDGRQAVTAGADGTLRLWRLPH